MRFCTGHARVARQAAQYATIARERSARELIKEIDTANGVKVSPFLVDRHQRGHDYLRISLTERCNLRCTYCMPAEGVALSPRENMLSTSEVLRLASLFVRAGVSKIRLTGGEPTLRHDLPEIISKIKEMRGIETLGLTTNGIALNRKLEELVHAGLTHVNLSLDTLDPFKFEIMTRRRGHASVMAALEKAVSLQKSTSNTRGEGLHSVKLNVVVIKGVNDMEVAGFVELARKMPISVRFIEYMPFDDNSWSTAKLVSSAQLLASARLIDPSISSLPGSISDTASAYAGNNWKGSIAFISSMTDHFCGGCSRLRLTADGRLKVCLFGEPKLNLRDLLRNGVEDPEILANIQAALQTKKYAHDGPTAIAKSRGALPMSHIGAYLGRSQSFPVFRQTTFNSQRSNLANYSSKAASLTHFDEATGKPRMVDVSEKNATKRTAVAIGSVKVSDQALSLVKSAQNKKGDVLAVAQLAGIMAAKRTSDLIPLCHPISLTKVDVDVVLADEEIPQINIRAEVSCTGKTGVEMEALTAVSVACLAVWDMLKAVGQEEMEIHGIRLLSKTGGKSDIK